MVRSFLFDDGLELAFEEGSVSAADLHHRFEEKFNVTVSLDDLAEASSNIFSLIGPSYRLLLALKSTFSGPMILLSNTNELHWQFIEKTWKISEHFDRCILSFEQKALKPHPRIYQAAVDATGFHPENCFFTDDLTENVIGARNIGLDAVEFSSAAQLARELEQRGIAVSFSDAAHLPN